MEPKEEEVEFTDVGVEFTDVGVGLKQEGVGHIYMGGV